MTEKATAKFIFDFKKLIETFTEICPDFAHEPNYANATVSRRFAEQVIFEYSKQAKEAKAKGKDKVWQLTLDTKSKLGKPLRNKVTILMCVTKQPPPPPQQPVVEQGNLQLTFKQASLLAVAKYCQIVPHLVLRQKIVLTPLAGAVFTKEDVSALATTLNEPFPQMLMAVISSCQTDGFYLEHSRCYIAVVALKMKVADLQIQASIVKKTIKMYQLQGKDFDMAKFEICNNILQSKKTNNCQLHLKNSEIDQIVSQIMSFNVKNEPSRSSSYAKDQMKKNNMKCGARFDGQVKRNP